jgi:methylenetetrahydrofolate reductase (NADPH)
MRDEGRYMDGREIKTPPRYFLGAAASPFASEPGFQALSERKNVNAGVQFSKSNLAYDLAHQEIWLNELAKRGILDKVFILVGVTPLKSLKMTMYMRLAVPEVRIPDAVLSGMQAPDAAGNAQEEGVQIALALIEGIRQLKGQGVHGLHLMAIGWEDIIPRIVTDCGVRPKPSWAPPAAGTRPASDEPRWDR